MENTLENKAKFFAQYYGQFVFLCGIHNTIDELTFIEEIGPLDRLELKPLSAISDEDASNIAVLYGWNKNGLLYKERLLQFKIDLPFIALKGFSHRHLHFVFDFLRSKGYALPFLGLSVESQISYGWVKLAEVC